MKRGRLITVGSFDGVHRGHQALLERTVVEARKRSLKTLALSFAIPPRMVLDESARRQILSDEREKAHLLSSFGMEEVEILRFDRALSETKPFSFFRDILLNRYGAKGIVVGADFRFGAGRSAGATELVRWGVEFQIPVWVISPVRYRRQVVSSTLIRSLMDTGHFRQAVDFLGHPYLIQGKVVRGRGIGRTLGFPTANIQTAPEKILPPGVFAVRVSMPGGRSLRSYAGVANIGVRPTFGAGGKPLVEVHLFGDVKSLPGRLLAVHLVKKIRAEMRFPGVEALKAQIAKDVMSARRILGAESFR